MKRWPRQTCQSWPLTPWVRWWAWGQGWGEVEDRERSQIFCASVLPNILELLSNQQVNVERWDHIRLVPIWGLWLMYHERNWGCCWSQLESQWCWEYQSAGCAPPTQGRLSLCPKVHSSSSSFTSHPEYASNGEAWPGKKTVHLGQCQVAVNSAPPTDHHWGQVSQSL